MVNDTVIRALSDLPKLDHVVLSCEGSQCLTQIIRAVEAVADKRTRKGGKTVSWSSIKSLGVQIAWRGWIDSGDRTTSVLSCIPPSITSLSLDIQRVNSASRYPEIHVPANILENLTFLSLSYNKLDSPTAFNTLVKAPNLTRLRLECWDSLQTWDAHKRDVVLLYSVESLELILGRTGTALKALPLLRFPNLKTLHLLMQERGSKDELEDIMDALKFLSPEVPNPARGLRSLTIVDQYPLFISGVNTLSRVLRNLPSLDHLSLKNITFDANSLVEHDGKKILPNLQRLELEHSGRHEFPFDALFDYVKKGGSTLEVLTR
ncbi:hypothetical protein NMY22_g4167 [Coprinellus aureogranulatus]|nr:hypothetical protein NMY22_g4167 [Coprinellus aureogranulatus]